MTMELSTNLMCVQFRSGVEIWLEKDRADKLQKVLLEGKNQFIEYDGQVLNRADIVGVFDANTMVEATKRKNGEWKCNKGVWHQKFQDCGCTKLGETCTVCCVNPCLCTE